MATKTASGKQGNPSGNGAEGKKFGKDTYMRWFKEMMLMRRFEEKTGQLYTMQKFGGFCHLYIGQEAILAGMITAVRPTDRFITGYRDHAHPLVLGMPSKYVMAELFGRITGSSKGKGGSMRVSITGIKYFKKTIGGKIIQFEKSYSSSGYLVIN